MNRDQRNYGRAPRKNEGEDRVRPLSSRSRNASDKSDIEEVLPPRSRRVPLTDKPLVNRCCWISPKLRSFGQLTEASDSPTQCEDMHYNASNVANLPDMETYTQLRELRKVFCGGSQVKVESSSEHLSPSGEYRSTDTHWQNVNDSKDVDEFILRGRDEGTLTRYHSLPKNFHISDVPRVKIIAEKFVKFKKHNVELRKLEEKVVCVEYDVFNQATGDLEPEQKMRVFFSIKPVNCENEAKTLKELPATIKNKFNISSEDLQKLSRNEVEMIDGKIQENQPYLQDLRKILRRNQISSKNNKNTLNLQNLYEMAMRDLLENESNFDANVLSKDELQCVQHLILENCKSSVHGISRRTVDASKPSTTSLRINTISRSLMNELLRDEPGMDMF